MLREADQAVVVVGNEETRSKSMNAALADAIEKDGLRARQVLLPRHVSPRLDTTKVPLVCLTEPDFVDLMISGHSLHASPQIIHATDHPAAKLLMTPTRNAAVAGPALREAHARVGRYLATEFISEVIGVEEIPIAHVQGHTTKGYRLLHEDRTLIVALMRGGEPLAHGVNDVFPSATFHHAKRPDDIASDDLRGRVTVVLVDSVVNSGETAVEFIRHIRRLHATIRIVVVAGAIQAEAVASGNPMNDALTRYRAIVVVGLRMSANKFTGKGATDTGNRLFNTQHLAGNY